MKPIISRCLLTLVVLCSFAGPALAQVEIAGSGSGSGTLTPSTGGLFHQEFNSTGVDTQFGSFVGHSTSDRDVSDPFHQTIFNGLFTEVFDTGTLFGTFTGTAALNPGSNNTGTLENNYIFTGGTGQFLNATGEARVTGSFVRTGPGTFTADVAYTGTLVLAQVPEPGTPLLLTALVLSGGVFRGLRRRTRGTAVRS